ncbi:MAG: hypothetical protein ABSG15_11905 [FCB group bacterium]|jgi:hypothetical protein
MENTNNNIVPQEDLELLSKLSTAYKAEREKLQIMEAVKAKIVSSDFINLKPAAKAFSKILLYGIPAVVIISAVAIFSFFKFENNKIYNSNVPINNIGQRQNNTSNINTSLANNVTVNKITRTDKTAIKDNLNTKRKILKHHKSKRIVVAGVNPNTNQKSPITKIKKPKKVNTPKVEK